VNVLPDTKPHGGREDSNGNPARGCRSSKADDPHHCSDPLEFPRSETEADTHNNPMALLQLASAI